MLLSILIPSVPSRRKTFTQNILDQIETQIESLNRSDVEVLNLYDNKTRKLGQKRNDLINLAQGKFLVFIDDDDVVSDDYLLQILNAIDNNSDTDCVVFDVICTVNDGTELLCKYGIELEYNHVSPEQGITWTGKPAHTHVYRTELAKKCVFPLTNYGEDFAWVSQAWHLVTKQTRIEKVLYFYKHNTNHTETRG